MNQWLKKKYELTQDHPLLVSIANAWIVLAIDYSIRAVFISLAIYSSYSVYQHEKREIKKEFLEREAYFLSEFIYPAQERLAYYEEHFDALESDIQSVLQVKGIADGVLKKTIPSIEKVSSKKESIIKKVSNPAIDKKSIPEFIKISENTVKKINEWRGLLKLPNLQSSSLLEEEALYRANELASRCQLDNHVGSEKKYGEVLYLGPSADQSVYLWADERKHYNGETGECSVGKVCGHWTQITWEKSKKIGCAEATCKNGNVVVVCEFFPPGNVQGEKPY